MMILIIQTGNSDLKFKFFRLSSTKAGTSDWGWPYIDVKYYKEQHDQIIKVQKISPDAPVPRNIFYPLKQRPLGDLLVLSPANTRAFLQVKYGRFVCASHSFNHMKDAPQTVIKVPCSEILDYYPCVHRTWTNKSEAWETLVLKGKTASHHKSARTYTSYKRVL